ncbi:uncharacterized protein MYCFIDRAFT_215206 [Pseudocercospora fijiensis CIRAD86]|uniref:Peptidase A1 domain-containing protein n=1 Tax=Pseudocercospora fijiensis (strain CIRAD86) TaxID=383855 RepID=M2ZVY2_PSEFD|nr:uncharacterized protein MYCFIDRAFT_215206 [Pseudocercospora fijiensis CIRAD86]EME83154.1 hypothetical protein MYCFIDRAFT_215206 [Pseudocercospora fijiensis CIRAD86]
MPPSSTFLARCLLLPTPLLSYMLHVSALRFIEPRHHDTTSASASTSTSIPAPISINPDQNWDGIDGPWNSFTLRVGTPEQTVRTLLSFASYQTWVVLPEGCQAAASQAACAESRGSLFYKNESSTWDEQGIYDLWIEKNLDYNGNAIYGYDTVALGGIGEGGPILKNTTVGALAVEDFYLGVLGVNPKPTNFTTFNHGSPSYMTLLKEQNYIPSLSFGYTAGAQYRFTGVLASLTLGGYDSNRFIDNNVTFRFAADNERDIVVAIQDLTTPSQISSNPTATKLLPSPVYAYIDSTVPGIWLPIEACRAFELEFGLVFDNDTQLYLVNDTLHDSLLDRDANVTFTLAQAFTGGPTVQITLPYAAFDLTAKPPFQGPDSSSAVSNDTNYFPLFRAQNDTQYTLGRAFMQEAYISVDWESAIFNVSQVAWTENAEKHLVPIIPSSESPGARSSASGDDHKSSRLMPGAIAGIAVGAVAVLALLGILLMFYFRKKRQAAVKRIESEKLSDDASTSAAATVLSGERNSAYQKAELEGSSTPSGPFSDRHRLTSSTNGSVSEDTPHSMTVSYNPGYYMTTAGASTPSSPSAAEGTHSRTQSGSFSLMSPLSATASEADSKERKVYEMPGDMPAIREKDGRALSEKEAIQRREQLYNGIVSTTPTSSEHPREGLREPRRVNPEEIVQRSIDPEPRDTALHRRFSFERQPGSTEELYD